MPSETPITVKESTGYTEPRSSLTKNAVTTYRYSVSEKTMATMHRHMTAQVTENSC